MGWLLENYEYSVHLLFKGAAELWLHQYLEENNLLDLNGNAGRRRVLREQLDTLIEYFGEANLLDLTPEWIEEFKKTRADRVGAAQAIRDFSMLRAVLGFGGFSMPIPVSTRKPVQSAPASVAKAVPAAIARVELPQPQPQQPVESSGQPFRWHNAN